MALRHVQLQRDCFSAHHAEFSHAAPTAYLRYLGKAGSDLKSCIEW